MQCNDNHLHSFNIDKKIETIISKSNLFFIVKEIRNFSKIFSREFLKKIYQFEQNIVRVKHLKFKSTKNIIEFRQN